LIAPHSTPSGTNTVDLQRPERGQRLALAFTLPVLITITTGVLGLKADDVRPTPAFSGAIDARHITAIASVELDRHERMPMLLDIDQLMAGTDIGLAL